MDPTEHLRPDSEPYHQILERVAEDWGLESSRTHLLRNGLNHVYEAKSRSGEELVVRVTDGAHSVELPERLNRGHWYEEREILMPARISAEFHGPTAAAMYRHQERKWYYRAW